MKNRFSFSSIMLTGLVLIAMILSSCGSKSGYKGAIPSDAPVVLEIDMESLTLKSNILSYKDQLADRLVESNEENETVLKVAEALRKMDDGGLNFHNPVYAFTNADIDGVFLLASVRSKETVAQTILNLGGGKFRVVEDEAEGLSWIETEDHTPIGVFNKEAFLLGASERKEMFAKLIQSDGGFFGTRMGRAMSNHAGDITLMVNAQSIDEDVMEAIRMRLMQRMRKGADVLDRDEIWGAICKTQAVLNLRFSVGEMSLNLYNAGEESSPKVLTKVSADVFGNIPSNGLIGMLAIGIDGEKLADVLESEVTKAGVEMNNETRMVLTMASSFIKAMNGTAAVTVSMDGYSSEPSIVGLLPIAKERTQYLFNLVTKELDKELYLTGDEAYSAISNQRAYRYGNVRMPLNMASHAEGCYAYGYFDLNEVIQKALEQERRSVKSRDKEMFYDALVEYVQMLGYAELQMKSYDEVSLILKLQENKRNSLDVLLKSTFNLGLQYFQYCQEAHPYDWASDDDYVYLEYLGEPDMFGEDAEWEELEEIEW